MGKDAWAKGYQETQAKYLEELRKEREAENSRKQQEASAAAAKAARDAMRRNG